MDELNIVGNNIRRLRIEAGLTQEGLALKSGLSQGYINQLESGKRRFTQKSMYRIKDALSVPMEDLFRENGVHTADRARKESRHGQKRRPSKKEFLALLSMLPDQIVEHYLILLKLEKEIWTNRKNVRYRKNSVRASAS